jgi:hypothetical protein
MRSRHALAVAAVVLAGAVLTPTVALSQTRRQSAALDEVKSRCISQIDRREKALSAEQRRVQNAKFLGSAHRKALEAITNKTSSGLSALADAIRAEADFDELRAECRRIVEDYRVFALVRPRTRLVLASDRELAAVAKLNGLADRIQSGIEKAKAKGRDTAPAEANLTTARTAAASVSSHAGGVYAAVIDLKASDYNANNNVLDAGRAEVRAARDSLRQAVAAARDARHALKTSAA